jgi:hypothetical protein
MMLARGLSAVLFLIFISASSLARAEGTPCAKQIGNCDYYLCRESIESCGENGYFLHFGYPYCEGLMSDVRPKMSEEGAIWMSRAATCLQEQVEAMPLTHSCEDMASLAIATHPDCYVSTGFCELKLSDQLLIAEKIWKSLVDPRIDRVMIEILDRCDFR